MADFCIVCFTEAVDTSDDYFNKKSQEYVCSICVDELIKLQEHQKDCRVVSCYCEEVDFNK